LYVATQDLSNPVGTSYEYRHALMDAVTQAVQKEPGRALFGYGPGTFRERGLEINFQNQVRRWYTCDNNWAAFLYETGYVGLLLISLLLFKPLLMTVQNYRRLPRPEKYLSGLFFISLAAFYFDLVSVAGYNWGQQGFMAWILISLSVVYPGLVLRERREAQLRQRTAEPASQASLQVVASQKAASEQLSPA
jgi:O-antigen ligase